MFTITKTTTIKKYLIIMCIALPALFYSCKKNTDTATCSGYAMYIPNSFTPNTDGVNDVFEPKASGIKEYEMWIYGNTGQQLYYTKDINKGWDGFAKGDSLNTCQQGIYLYKMNATDTCGNIHNYTGNFSLIK